MEQDDHIFERLMRPGIIAEIRQKVGEENYKRMVDEIGEEELVRRYLNDINSNHGANKTKYVKWLKNGILIILLPVLLGFVFYLLKQGFFYGFIYGFVLNVILIGVYNVILKYRHSAVIFCLVAFIISLIIGLVFIFVPSLKNEHGITAFIISGIFLILFFVSLVVSFWACPKCGSLSSKHHVEYGQKLPGYPNVEYHSEICNSCGHKWARQW
jgi:hypothetical protein